MAKAMKVLAIVVLLVTIAGAGVLLFAVNHLSPAISQVGVMITPAQDAQEIFEATIAQLENETFTGRVFADTVGLSAEESTFLTYTVRLENKGLFPVEWVSLDIHPAQEDICQLDNYSANVLGSRMQGDIAATMLTRGDGTGTQCAYTVTCYTLGRKMVINGVME